MINERIGGTDASTIMNANRFQNILELWQIKTGRRPKPDLSDNEKVKWGRKLETIIITDILEDRGLEFNEKQHNYELREGYRVGYIDYYLNDDEFIEAKTTSEYSLDEWLHGVPEYYLWQVVHYFGLTKAKSATVACLVGGQKLVQHTIYRDEELITALWKAEEEFHRMVVEDIEPELEAVPEYSVNYNMEPQIEQLIERYLEITQQIKPLEQSRDEIKKAIQILLGKNQEQIGTRYKASYKYILQNKYDIDALCKENNIDKEKYKIPAGYYKLDIREIKEEK
jgi:predicted phage-related endonuclease